MKNNTFKIYKEFGALNSPVVLDAVAQGLVKCGYKSVNSNEEISIIWSVLWQGRMQQNQIVYQQAKLKNKPVIVIEVGNLKRNVTWRISIDNVNRLGIFANTENLDLHRPAKLGLNLKDYQTTRNSSILITTQHEHSLQWQFMPVTKQWLESTIKNIKLYSDKQITIRPHPRCNLKNYVLKDKDVVIQTPKKVTGSYDEFDIDYNYHCVINHNSGPAIQAAINGTPVVCHSSSLAYPVSNVFSNMENLKYTDRQSWFLELCHTEWTIDEIKQGIPFDRLRSEIEKYSK